MCLLCFGCYCYYPPSRNEWLDKNKLQLSIILLTLSCFGKRFYRAKCRLSITIAIHPTVVPLNSNCWNLSKNLQLEILLNLTTTNRHYLNVALLILFPKNSKFQFQSVLLYTVRNIPYFSLIYNLRMERLNLFDCVLKNNLLQKSNWELSVFGWANLILVKIILDPLIYYYMYIPQILIYPNLFKA